MGGGAGSLAYAAQNPWIFNSSVRNNVLFGKPYDASAYSRAVTSCALSTDLKLVGGVLGRGWHAVRALVCSVPAVAAVPVFAVAVPMCPRGACWSWRS